MLLANSYRPDIAYVVHQCSRFTNFPKASHGAAGKRIIRYFRGKKYKGLAIFPRKTLQVDCHIDADFSGLWNVEHEQDTIFVKSPTEYLILFVKYPLLCTSKLQTQIAHSTMEAEYTFLSTAMRELIGIS